jgi:single-stranded-DNA-specific exonuclease
VRDPQTRNEWDAIAFRQGNLFGQLGPRIDVAFTLEANEFIGERKLQLNVKDVRKAQKLVS